MTAGGERLPLQHQHKVLHRRARGAPLPRLSNLATSSAWRRSSLTRTRGFRCRWALQRARYGVPALTRIRVLSRGDPCRPTLRPTATHAAVVRNVCLTSILLKNSNFRGDHNSEDRWQPRWKFPWGLSGATDLSAYDALLALAVASTRGDNAFRAEVGFSRHLNFRLFQQYPSSPAGLRRVEVWRGGCRSSISVCRPFRPAVL